MSIEVSARRTLVDAEDTRSWGRALASVLQAGDIVLLTGELGAGKTTLTQGLAEGLQVRGPITSPTFVIARIHPSLVDGPDLVHVDAYRIGGSLELEDLDLDASVDRSVTVVEWGHGMAETLAESWLEVDLRRALADEGPGLCGAGEDEEEVSDPRTVRAVGHGPRWEGFAGAVG
ncbi:tRNA threonylcarbamoyladenosine biosynthesis protein TsaE [Austwickia chelonae]|uniref:tRNA threonylcarbamoyladenosine biosynthesis protein TsaE n=1 Tax=Austwickia chelonae NBRC 105200 TaxID=1184607 RepID=K6V759_9MICO|nr:tRNA (adenosine(37)-N6)-threonylcarbamoyltransferase complex ATPase subunit type 1 TsaE [Austwickia chelonae]GAB78038.1 hypothetical protein AUCHE_08_02820 [Austwickia chelonae NBRC 105200]SEV94916.1 tRNA threonylcarbamoyladenosine biosynthesis protein TsaE [Austwickia chelonae]